MQNILNEKSPNPDEQKNSEKIAENRPKLAFAGLKMADFGLAKKLCKKSSMNRIGNEGRKNIFADSSTKTSFFTVEFCSPETRALQRARPRCAAGHLLLSARSLPPRGRTARWRPPRALALGTFHGSKCELHHRPNPLPPLSSQKRHKSLRTPRVGITNVTF